ncbi:MAG: hypothetical protein KKI15_07585 [Proteobacteria bacterium]|nr:hypothetical protein [Pseudomonadota bacterium]
MKVKHIAACHVVSFLVAGIFMSSATPLLTGYFSWSIVLWFFGYPLYYFLGEPGWE